MIKLKINMVTTQDYYLQIIKLKLKISLKILVAIKKCLTLVIYLIKSKYYPNSNKLVVGKMNDETGDVAIEEFVD